MIDEFSTPKEIKTFFYRLFPEPSRVKEVELLQFVSYRGKWRWQIISHNSDSGASGASGTRIIREGYASRSSAKKAFIEHMRAYLVTHSGAWNFDQEAICHQNG